MILFLLGGFIIVVSVLLFFISFCLFFSFDNFIWFFLVSCFYIYFFFSFISVFFLFGFSCPIINIFSWSLTAWFVCISIFRFSTRLFFFRMGNFFILFYFVFRLILCLCFGNLVGLVVIGSVLFFFAFSINFPKFLYLPGVFMYGVVPGLESAGPFESSDPSSSLRSPNPVYSDEIEFIEMVSITPPPSNHSSSLISAKDYVVRDGLYVNCSRANYCSTMAIISVSIVGFSCVGMGFFLYYLNLV